MTKTTEETVYGVVSKLGYLICERCWDAGHTKGGFNAFVYGAPHSEEYCDCCASLLSNKGEP